MAESLEYIFSGEVWRVFVGRGVSFPQNAAQGERVDRGGRAGPLRQRRPDEALSRVALGFAREDYLEAVYYSNIKRIPQNREPPSLIIHWD